MILKKLAGRTDVEDKVLQLDMLIEHARRELTKQGVANHIVPMDR